MRTLVLFALVLVSGASALVEVGAKYHETVGIPTAERIRAYEEELFKRQSPLERIVGGSLVHDISEFPYLAGLLISLVGTTGNSVCGSSLLSANRLVTAAHCWFDGWNQAWQFEVILGTHLLFSGGTRITTSQVTLHPSWNTVNLANDVAVIALPRNVEFSARIQPISLPTSFELWFTYEGMRSLAAGYGRTRDDQAGASIQVSSVYLEVVSNLFCQAIYSPEYVRESTICTSGAGGVGICGGDSGGPLVTFMNSRLILIGVCSFVAAGNCQGGFPSAYARVTSFVNFINQHL